MNSCIFLAYPSIWENYNIGETFIKILQHYFLLNCFLYIGTSPWHFSLSSYNSYFLSSDISRTYSSLLLSSWCLISFLYVNTIFFPDAFFSSHLVFLSLLTPSSLPDHSFTEVRRVDSDWFLKSWVRIPSSSSASPLWQLTVQRYAVFSLGPAERAKGNSCEIRLDRVTTHSHLLCKASFPIIGIFALWLHKEHIHKFSKASIWRREKKKKKKTTGWAFSIISANSPFPYSYSLQFKYKSVYCYHHYTALFECWP